MCVNDKDLTKKSAKKNRRSTARGSEQGTCSSDVFICQLLPLMREVSFKLHSHPPSGSLHTLTARPRNHQPLICFKHTPANIACIPRATNATSKNICLAIYLVPTQRSPFHCTMLHHSNQLCRHFFFCLSFSTRQWSNLHAQQWHVRVYPPDRLRPQTSIGIIISSMHAQQKSLPAQRCIH